MILEDNTLGFNLSVKQNADDDIRKIQESLENEESSEYELRDGLVYKKMKGQLLFYVPSVMEHSILYSYHNDMGHVGVGKTLELILRTYWFPKLRSKVTEHINNCLKCIVYSPVSGKKEDKLHSIPKGIPFLLIPYI